MRKVSKLKCTRLDCEYPLYCKGLCRQHYQKEYNATYQQTPKYKALQRSPKPRYQTARSHATKRGIVWDLSFTQYLEICSLPCFYCGQFFTECGSGLDRKDPKGPYSISNIVPCCGKCNFLKGRHLSVEEMQQVVKVLVKMRGGILWSTG